MINSLNDDDNVIRQVCWEEKRWNSRQIIGEFPIKNLNSSLAKFDIRLDEVQKSTSKRK